MSEDELIKQLKIANMDPEYWESIVVDVDTPITVPPGSSFEVIDIRERGKLVSIGCHTNNKDAILEVYVDNFRSRGTFAEQYNLGLTQANSATFWISKYDTVNDIYVAWLTPIPPRDYFGRITFRVYSPSTSSTIVTYFAYRYKLKEE